MVTKVLLALALLIVFLGYMLYNPADPDEDNPWRRRIIGGMFGLSFLGGFVGEKLGLGTQLNITRSILDYTLRVASPSVDPETFRMEDANFNGVPVRIYTPKKLLRARLPGLVYMHGGGWVTGSVYAYDFLAAYFAVEAHMVVVSVEYQRAPEVTFPVPVEDCRKAVEYFINNAAKFSVDPNSVAVGGDSAGGNLAAAVSLILRDAKFQPMPKAQVLIYPVLQMIDFNTPSHFKARQRVSYAMMWTMIRTYFHFPEKYEDAMDKNGHVTPILRQKYGKFVSTDLLPKDFITSDYKPSDPNIWDKTVPQDLSEKFVNPSASPGLAEDLRGLPEAFIFTAGGDGFRDDGAMFVERLKRSGIKSTLLNIAGTFHGCCMFVSGPLGTENGRKANNAIVQFLRETL